jgi:hypothetical protein
MTKIPTPELSALKPAQLHASDWFMLSLTRFSKKVIVTLIHRELREKRDRKRDRKSERKKGKKKERKKEKEREKMCVCVRKREICMRFVSKER